MDWHRGPEGRKPLAAGNPGDACWPLHSSPRARTSRRRFLVRNCFSLSLLLFGLFVSDAAPAGGHQLPPQVLLDQLLLRTERLLEADELGAVVEAMEEGFALAGEHELELPPDFRFKHARVTFAVGLLGAAKESVTEYLTASTREAESYLDAVGLLEDVKRILERRDAQECSQDTGGFSLLDGTGKPSRVLCVESESAA